VLEREFFRAMTFGATHSTLIVVRGLRDVVRYHVLESGSTSFVCCMSHLLFE
jgi:hypothetical protein